jgi:hypothetical protein
MSGIFNCVLITVALSLTSAPSAIAEGLIARGVEKGVEAAGHRFVHEAIKPELDCLRENGACLAKAPPDSLKLSPAEIEVIKRRPSVEKEGSGN